MDKPTLQEMVTNLQTNTRRPRSIMYDDLLKCIQNAKQADKYKTRITCEFSKHDDASFRNAILCSMGIHVYASADDSTPGRETFWYTLDNKFF